MNAEPVLVDTDVVSFLFKADTRAQLYQGHLAGRRWVLSFMSLGELYEWAEDRGWGRSRRRQLEDHLGGFHVHGFTPELCRMWAQVRATARRGGREIDIADAWIAATALLHDLPLVTHNRRHYEGVEGLRIISEAP